MHMHIFFSVFSSHCTKVSVYIKSDCRGPQVRPPAQGQTSSPHAPLFNIAPTAMSPQIRIISLTPTLMVVIVGRWWVQQKQIVAAAERLPYQYKKITRAKRHEERQNEECIMSMKQKFKLKLARTTIVFFHEWGSPSCRNSDPHPGALNTTHSAPHRIAAEPQEKCRKKNNWYWTYGGPSLIAAMRQRLR